MKASTLPKKDKRVHKQSHFSRFFLHASDTEQKKVFTKAAHEANREQREIFTKAGKTDRKVF